tara:strand:+ start:204 stop:389 length:186 start_codon:yes stop_codon:yes gene_type:complete
MKQFVSAISKYGSYRTQDPHSMTAFTAFMVANEKNTIEPAAFSQWDFTTTERSFPYIGASL